MLLVQIVNGLMEGVMLFMVASGLTLIFGVSRIVNFAHGSFFMLGAFLTYQFAPHVLPGTMPGFILAIVTAGLVTAVVGAAFEMIVLRRIYHAEALLQLLVTVGLVMIMRDVVRVVWGMNDLATPIPDAMNGAVVVADYWFPIYNVGVMGAGIAVALVLWSVVRFTRVGVLLRAATDDRGMVALLGINQAHIFTGVFAAGALLAGIAGGLAAPLGSINFLLDTTIITGAFLVVVIGGLGNLSGAFVAALAIGVLKAVGVLYFPRAAMALAFIIMAVVLVVRSFKAR
ncbi:branched-chain amino acid ABC transporter permease [Dechloromonas agitata]|uniref:branched-chain amino acid ABC transporter permease n=1 Tax=Dechloromonas agitata TaxID=73030 RepID=UPI00237E10A3|nr:branched-chain amino acid ABC transporter permease [Dechloromonas agitata]MDE1544054.1 branched-chain amino acid ABC transporter permease [Dechloromonas agitata]